ncbi:MAG: hypothetical protein ACXIUV_14185 [Alkalilacustris sp.]
MTSYWLIRMYRWVRRPPSPRMVVFVLAIVALCFLLLGIELVWGWPEALTPNSGGGRRMW